LGSIDSRNPINTRYYIENGENNSKTYWLDEGLSSLIAGKYSDTYALKVNDYFVQAKNAQPTLPTNYIDALKALVVAEEAKQLALAQAEYQDRALTTSQVRNSLKTKENKKLKAQLRGYADNYVSITQYVAHEKINVKDISTNSIVRQLKTVAIAEQDIVKLTLPEDKYPSTCFSLDFLDEHKENILVMVELLKQKKSLTKYFEFI